MRIHTAILTLCTLVTVYCGCSRNTESNVTKHEETPRERALALAHQYNCQFFNEEVRKAAGTNALYSIYVQRVLNSNKRFVALATLRDVLQSGEKVEAIFEIENADDLQCVARLECPTNFISELTSSTDEWGVIFDADANHHTLNIGQLVDGNETVITTALTVEGKIVGLEKF